MSYYPTTIGSVISVIAVNATTVSVRLPTHGNNPSSNPTVRHPVTGHTFNAGQTFQVSMTQYQAMQVSIIILIILTINYDIGCKNMEVQIVSHQNHTAYIV